MFDAYNDRGGIGLAQRARDNRYASEQEDMAVIEDLNLPPALRTRATMDAQFNQGRARSAAQGYNQQWDKMFQALQEAGVDKLADESGALKNKNYQADGSVSPVPASNSIANPPSYDPFTVGHANQAAYDQSALTGLRTAANPNNNTLRHLKGRSSLKADSRTPY